MNIYIYIYNNDNNVNNYKIIYNNNMNNNKK